MISVSLPSQGLFGCDLAERDLLAIAVELGAESVGGWSSSDRAIIKGLPRADGSCLTQFREQIRLGGDPMGEVFCALRSREVRRAQGATYTPHPIVKAMVDWCCAMPPPVRVVDPGCGSGRFLLETGRRFPASELVGVEIDPVAAVVARGNLAARGWQKRGRIVLADFREFTLDRLDRPTLFVGNPPYVRHHLIPRNWKEWLSSSAKLLGVPASQLCGLHLYFYLATAMLGFPGDYGAYITAAEWMDVNYGELLRKLAIRHLGVQTITLIEPTAQPFPDAATTASITSFMLHTKPKAVSFRRVEDAGSLAKLPGAKRVSIERLENETRWTVFTRASQRTPKGYIDLGELCRVHRGQVTGANDVWIVDSDVELPSGVLFPTITRARELFEAGPVLQDASHLRRVVDLPVDLDDLGSADRRLVDAFLKTARARGADRGYVAENRRAWWAVGLRIPAPILCTYMARRSPAFVENGVNARHINIAHGLYPREPLSKIVMRKLITFLTTKVSINLGRTYAGGLTKFEPGEIERIPVPEVSLLEVMPV